MFAYAPTAAPSPRPADDAPHLRLVRARPRSAPRAVRAAAGYCAGLTAGLLAVAVVSAPTGDASAPLMLAIFSAAGLAAALATGRHHQRS